MIVIYFKSSKPGNSKLILPNQCYITNDVKFLYFVTKRKLRSELVVQSARHGYRNMEKAKNITCAYKSKDTLKLSVFHLTH